VLAMISVPAWQWNQDRSRHFWQPQCDRERDRRRGVQDQD